MLSNGVDVMPLFLGLLLYVGLPVLTLMVGSFTLGYILGKRKIKIAAIKLRTAQRSYMANRGNDSFGVAVGRAAQELDEVLDG